MNGEAVIVGAALAAGHDGQAEVAVALRYANGATRTAVFSYDAVAAALDAAGVTRLDELAGRSWTVLLGAETERNEGATCST